MDIREQLMQKIAQERTEQTEQDQESARKWQEWQDLVLTKFRNITSLEPDGAWIAPTLHGSRTAYIRVQELVFQFVTESSGNYYDSTYQPEGFVIAEMNCRKCGKKIRDHLLRERIARAQDLLDILDKGGVISADHAANCPFKYRPTKPSPVKKQSWLSNFW